MRVTGPVAGRWIVAIAVLGLASLAPPAARIIVASQTPQAPTPQQPPPIFRGGIVLVPIDVSVVDRNGKPVTDLKQEDFIVFEDKVRQEIKAFSANALVPEAPPPGATPMLVRATQGDRVTPQTRRTFLIVLGVGRIQEPTKALDATIQFIRQRLLPQDLVSVLAFDRATDLMTDHEQVAEVVERYKTQHEAIYQEIDHWLTFHPGEEIPAGIQAHIDAVFGPHLRSATNMILGTDEFRKRDEFDSHEVPWNLKVVLGDVLKLYAGIEYLRYLDGEKHLIVCAEKLLGWDDSVQDDERLAARAGDARIVLDIIHTGGVPAFQGWSRGELNNPVITAPAFFFGAASSERVAELTGGQFLGTRYARETFAKVDQATRFGYLLGYAPANPALDDRFRKVTVKVNRPDVTVLFRHGYHAQEDLPPLDLPALLKATRRASAASYDRESHDIKLDATASLLPRLGLVREIRVDVTIDASRIGFTLKDGQRTGGLDITIYCGDAKQTVVGQARGALDLALNDDAYQRALTDGIKYTARVPVTAAAKYVKVIVYDFGADLTGTAMLTIK
jgi:VWFA-related protein